jgi:sugar phosphate isomerase/epimerase
VGQALARTTEHLLEIVARVDSPACQVYYDIGNGAWQGADPVGDLRALGRHLAMVHVKDRRVVNGKSQTVIVGDGIIDWPASARALREVGYDGYAVLEVPGAAETADEIAVRSREALRAAGF